jgi:hypothetical protein
MQLQNQLFRPAGLFTVSNAAFFSSLVWDDPPDSVIQTNGTVSQGPFSGADIVVHANTSLAGPGAASYISNLAMTACPSELQHCAVDATFTNLVGDNYITLIATDQTFTNYYLNYSAPAPGHLISGPLHLTFDKPSGVTGLAIGYAVQSAAGTMAADTSVIARLVWSVP